MTKIGEDKDFYKKMLVIGVPVLFQNLISIGLNLLDTLMIGMLGEQELAAVGAANQVYLIFTVSLFGLFSGSAVYTAQYWGTRDIAGIRKMLGIDYIVGIIFALLVSILSFIFAPQLIHIFSKDDSVIGFGTDYLRCVSFSFIFSGASQAISYNSRAIQNLKAPTIVSAIALLVNGVLNYLLIFGVGIFPAMGVKGAATATFLARIFELCALVIYIYTRKEHPLKAGIRSLIAFDREHFAHVMKMAVPVIFSEGSWALSVSLIYAIYGILGTSALAVAQVANVVCDMLQCLYMGIGNASAMSIGEVLGRGEKNTAYRYGKKSMNIVWIFNVITTLFLLLMAKPIANFYHFSGETNHLLVTSLIVMAITITPRILAYMYCVGILRAGGDTVFCMKLEIICNMFIQVPVAFIAVWFFHVSLPLAMLIGEIGNVVRIAFAVPRFKSRKWINVVTDVEIIEDDE